MVYYYLGFMAIIITVGAQIFVSSSYTKYKRINNKKNTTGFDVARAILDSNGLDDIKILETKGNLTDHYDPTRKVVKLSSDIYDGTTIASMSVAAHECGHALQDKDKYGFMILRSKLVPVVNFTSKIGYIVLLLGWLFSYELAILGIILLCGMLLFNIITLPVEFNASKRALSQLQKLNLNSNNEKKDCKKMLSAAAFTYVASLVTTLLQILRLLLMSQNRR